MGEDIRPGDVVACVDDSAPKHPYWVKRGIRWPIRRGTIIRVRSWVQAESGDWGLVFFGFSFGRYERSGGEIPAAAHRFRKLPKADEEFTASIRACKPSRNRVPA